MKKNELQSVSMIIREATVDDIPQIQLVRNSVRENKLSDPRLVTDEDCKRMLTISGKGWVCETENQIAGFAIADAAGNNIWALFIKPGFEKQGIGRQLHNIMLRWYFEQTTNTVWLSTAPGTRAEKFYFKAGWNPVGTYGKGETKFEMTYNTWLMNKQ